MTQFDTIFEPLLRQYCATTNDLSVRSEIASIFIPTVGLQYNEAARKIFYMGRDTNGWSPCDLQECYDKNCFSDYFENSAEFLNEQDFLHYNNNKSSGFWSAAIRMHLRIKGILEYVKISGAMPENYRNLLHDFGYGNTNAIEVHQSLQKQGMWEDLDQGQYWKLKEISRPLDKLIHTIKAFNPQLVFIFNWDCDEKIFLEGLNFEIKKLSLIENNCYDISLKDYPTKIIWTTHPSNARYFGYSAADMVNEIYDYIAAEGLV